MLQCNMVADAKSWAAAYHTVPHGDFAKSVEKAVEKSVEPGREALQRWPRRQRRKKRQALSAS
ncbi:MAG: hypothetical protein JWQ76_673 [Ramlibacter sp.]|nr:hypothetical protein [Ramlibacter sp.]